MDHGLACVSACYDARVHRIVGRVLPIILLLAFAASIGDSAPDLDLGSLSHHYDGDWDDAGHVGKLRAHGIEAAVTDYRPTVAPREPARPPARRDTPRPPQVAHKPVGSRAPPA
jgi:hypothetical protein